jgi:hypothetical protein
VNRALAVSYPASDAQFGEHVRAIVQDDDWDLDSAEGVALLEAVLRATYPMATVVADRTTSAGWAPRVVLDVYRDGPHRDP